MRIFYCPLEPYKERYTCQLSAPKIGWLESRWIENKIEYFRVDGKSLNKEIKTGSVLDGCGRGYWACSQVMELLGLINCGAITSEDVIYFDDFFHPGVSALPYAFYINEIRPKMFALLHAQTVDVNDFTYPMRHWMRYFEWGTAKILDGIFVTSSCLKDLCVYGGIGNESKVHLTGLPYNSDEVKTHFPKVMPKRKKQVIFTSRWDWEKNPSFYLKVIDHIMEKRQDITFLITTSATKLRSNATFLLTNLKRYLSKYPDNLFLKENLTKDEYYFNLLESKVQFNCAEQDFVSWTLLEATTCGCTPVYPNYLSFPECLNKDSRFLYNKGSISHAAELVCHWVDSEAMPDVSYIYKPFDSSWLRMLNVMQGNSYDTLY